MENLAKPNIAKIEIINSWIEHSISRKFWEDSNIKPN